MKDFDIFAQDKKLKEQVDSYLKDNEVEKKI